FKDYTIPEHFTKNTGIEIKNMSAYCLKEKLDNSADVIEKHWHGLPSEMSEDEELSERCITAVCYNNKSDNKLSIKVSNNNSQNIPFPDLKRIFNYKRSLSSKAQQYRVSRGAQGDALKQLGVAGCLMNCGNDWNFPICFEHNLRQDLVYINIDRKNNRITPDVENRFDGTASHNLDVNDGVNTITGVESVRIRKIPTSIEITLPKIQHSDFAKLIQFWMHYTLFNTHLTYSLYTDLNDNGQDQIIYLPATQRMSKFRNPTTVYAYTHKELEILLNDSADKNKSVYDALNQIGFRELNQPNRFTDLKRITVSDVTPEQVKTIHKRLQKSMEPMSRLDRPYQDKTKQRKYAMIKRYKMINYEGEELDFDKAVYEISSPSSLKDNIYKDQEKATQYVYYFEVLMIPIKDRDAKNKIISGVNFSTSITNREYFSGQYTNTYQWYHNNGNGGLLEASDIDEIIMKSMIGKNIDYIDNASMKKVKMPCVVIAHLVSQKVDYRGGYGKSQLVLEPFAEDIATTIERAMRRVPSKEKYYPSDKIKPPSLTTLLADLLVERWHSICENLKILDPYNVDYYDPWSQSTVWYHFSEEKLKPIRDNKDGKYDLSKLIEGQNTRSYIVSKISEICENDPRIGVPREKLGIFASARAQFYFKGEWHSVYLDDIPKLCNKGVVVVFIEKVGIVEQIKHIIDKHGIAFVNTQGHFAEYPKTLVSEIVMNGGYVVILTDFDCAGIHIAERVITQVLTELRLHGVESPEKKVMRLGVDIQMLEYFISKGLKGSSTNGSDSAMTLAELRSRVEESYPTSQKREKQKPQLNVVSSIIGYAARYQEYLNNPDTQLARIQDYGRYEYVYNDFTYLTGLKMIDIITDDYFSGASFVEKAIQDAMERRPQKSARRI
ncbi:MAG: hypothetical protein WCA39_13920, partial [Nitrososphaeraceae archaeon]